MTLEEMSLNYGLLLLSLPRTLGKDPKTGKEVSVGIGRYGPYVHRGGTYRNLKSPVQLFEIGLEEAVDLLETRPGREVLKELGPHPESGAELQVLDGRYGPYVTDGSVNASLPKGSDPEDLEMEEALDLLARAAARKGKRRGGRKKTGKKSGKTGAKGSKSGRDGGKGKGARGKKS
jgi:DNA topoisomerase-1